MGICFCFQMGASSQISANTQFHQHVSIVCRKAGARLRILQRLSSYIDEHSRMTIFRSFVLSNNITVHWCGTFAKQHIHLKWNLSSTEL